MHNKTSAWGRSQWRGERACRLAEKKVGVCVAGEIRPNSGRRGRCLGQQRFLSVKNQEIKLFGPTTLPLSIGGQSKPRKTTNQLRNAATIRTVPWQGALGILPCPLQWPWLLLGQLSPFQHWDFPYFFSSLGNYYRNPLKIITTRPHLSF